MPSPNPRTAPVLPERVHPHSRPLPQLMSLLLIAFCVCCGCSTVHLKPRVTNIADYSREKDIKTYVITVDSKMKDEDYKNWTQQHFEENRLCLENPGYEGIPIYEIHYHFVLRRPGYRPRRIAFLIWRNSPDDPSKMNHLFTYIGSSVSMQNWILR